MLSNVAYGAGHVGHERLVPILEAQLRGAATGCLALTGMRGLGKTTLSRALCQSMQRSFPGRACYLELPSTLPPEGTGGLREQLISRALYLLGIYPQPGANPGKASHHVDCTALQPVCMQLQPTS